ncbi:MAG: hypothetical protein C0494_05835 [Sphingobium sp.]|nr:hypothetical protein [Sphingobium sp.]
MTGSINSLIGLSDEPWHLSKLDSKRQAVASLRGYAYQLHQSLAAWIALPDDATLHLEVSEDYAQIARDPASLETVLTATQVKETRESGSITLNSDDVKAAIRAYWALRKANAGRQVRFAFLTTSPIGQERIDPVDGGAGLALWERAARSGALDGLRRALAGRFTSAADEDSGLAAFLRDSGDDELRSELIAPVRWLAGEPPIETIAKDNRAALIILGERFGGLPDFSARAADILLAQILDTIVSAGDRRLRRGDLLLILQEAISIRVPAGHMLFGVAPARQGLDLEATGSWRSVEPLPAPCAPREAAIGDLRATLSSGGVIWVHGATGLGKSSLAILAAEAMGGQWHLLDLRGVLGPIARERLAAVRIAILTGADLGGVIIDDITPSHEGDIEASLRELALSLKQRGTSLIVTSNHPPGQRLTRALGLLEAGIYAAPSFEPSDAAALVVAYGGDPEKWSQFALLVGGGHPQLVDAAIAGLARVQWPDNAKRAWAAAGMKNPDVEAEREAARRRLLAELSPDVLGFLARTVRIYGSFDRPLSSAVSAVDPVLGAPGLALDQLSGHWIERLSPARMRSSPLVAGLDTEMLDAATLKSIDKAIATHILTRETVDADLIDTAFYHAWLAEEVRWITWLVQYIIQTSDEERVKLASLMPMFRGAQADPPFLTDWPYPRMLLRLAQHLLESAIGNDEHVAQSARRLVDRLDRLTLESEMRQSLVGIVLMKLLYDPHGYGRIPGWFDYVQRFARIMREESQFSGAAEAVGAHGEADPARYVFVSHALHLPGLAALASLFDALDALPRDARQTWLDAMYETSFVVGMVIDNVWLKESQREGFDAQGAAATFERLGVMANAWASERLAGRCFRAQALLLDEFCKDIGTAYAALERAAILLPGNFDIARERGKIAWRADDYPQAYTILRGLEDRLAEVDGLDAAFALREAAISAAEIGKPLEAARLFEKAHGIALEDRDGRPSPLSVGLAADAAAARFGAGDEAAAVRSMVSILDDLALIDPLERPTTHAIHILAKHIVLWMRSRHQPLLVEGEPPCYPPGAASNPSPNPGLSAFPVTPIEPAWMMLAKTALQVGLPSDEVLAWRGLVAARDCADLDAMVRYDLLDQAIATNNLGDFRRFLVPAVEAFVHLDDRNMEGSDYDPLVITKGRVAPLPPEALREGKALGYLRDTAISQALLASTENGAPVGGHLVTRSIVMEVAGFDAMPEWGAGAVHDGSDYRQIVAHALALLIGGELQSVETVYLAHLRLLEWVRASQHKKIAVPGLARRMRQDWSIILKERRALLVMPIVNVPSIEATMQQGNEDMIFMARLMLAAEPAVSIGLAEEMRVLLRSLGAAG